MPCRSLVLLVAISVTAPSSYSIDSKSEAPFRGEFFSGTGDVEYLELLEIARSMFDPNPAYQNLAMLYTPNWNGLVEGPTWGAWWVQNSYGTTYCALPFLLEPWITFLQNSQDLWFDQMGDGKRVGAKDWIAPDGCLCDCASPGWIMYKQGDGRTDIHDWGMEFTAAGLLMQAELLLISRDQEKISHYLPLLRRCAAFIETRRDPANNLFLAGPAGNLLAPSYAGWKKADGCFGQAYLAGLSVSYIAALDRLIELERLMKNDGAAQQYRQQCDSARHGLDQLATSEGYLIRSLDPDGIRHGVYGAEKHGYFEASPNHDAVAFRVVDDASAERILRKIESIPGLRPFSFILPNYPSYDDMYEEPAGLWEFGTWVNGGHWSTCEARMILAYSRTGRYEDCRKSMKHLLTFADRFRMDNPLTKFGSDVYQPEEAINLCYDSFGPAAALVRGLFEYIYKADELILIPHIPDTVHSVEQHFPIRFGEKKIFVSAAGNGAVSSVVINGKQYSNFKDGLIHLRYDELPDEASVTVYLGGAAGSAGKTNRRERLPLSFDLSSLPECATRVSHLQYFQLALNKANLQTSYEAAHAKKALDVAETIFLRKEFLKSGSLKALPEPAASATDRIYLDSFNRLYDGLEKVLSEPARKDPSKKQLAQYWQATQKVRQK